MKVWKELGGYDAWGVKLPNGYVREFTTEDNARKYVQRMEGQRVLDANSTSTVWTGLRVMHRYIPTWTDLDQEQEL